MDNFLKYYFRFQPDGTDQVDLIFTFCSFPEVEMGIPIKQVSMARLHYNDNFSFFEICLFYVTYCRIMVYTLIDPSSQPISAWEI